MPLSVSGAPGPPALWSCSAGPFPLGLHKKHIIQNISCQYWLLTIANSGAYSSGPERNAAACYNIQSIATEECVECHGGHLQSVTFKQ